MALDFPSNPTTGQVVEFSGKIYEWDGEKWIANTQVTKTEIGLSNVANYGVATAGTATDDVDLQIAGTTVDNKYMTPYKTAYYISGILADQAEAEAGSDDEKLMTPERTAQAIAELQSTNADTATNQNTEQTAVTNLKFWQGTQDEYDDLTPDSDTLYFITED